MLPFPSPTPAGPGVRFRRRWPAAAAALACALGAPAPARPDIDLAADGRSSFQIVLPADAIPAERHAAEELRTCLERISGAALPIVSDAAPATPHEIVLGRTNRAEPAGLEVDFSGLGQEGFRLETRGAKLFVSGGRPRGTLYGVYTLLEEELGVRWFTPEVEVVPAARRLPLPKLARTVVPALEYREVFWTEVLRDPGFAARHRLNGGRCALREEHGGRAVVFFPFVHTFEHLVPSDLFEDHPEYFPLIDGVRKGGNVQRCLSNPDVLRLAKARVREWIRDHPEATIVSVSQNDNIEYCRCGGCRALDEAEGSPAATVLRFVNAIAADIEADHPGILVDTLAYQYTRKLPKTIRPRANVVVRLCSIECCFAHPLGSCASEENRAFRGDIAAWNAATPHLYVWDYTTNFAHYQQPFPNVAALQPNVRFFVAHGVKGLFEQGNYSWGGHGELAPLRAYLLAKLLWNPDADIDLHRREFLRACYGSAADAVGACIDLMQSRVQPDATHAMIYDPPEAAYLDDDLLDRADRLLDDAEAAAGGGAVRDRVLLVRLPFWYVRLAAGRVSGPARQALLERFLAVVHKAGITDIGELMPLAKWERRMAEPAAE
jgi:hypothetical protein